ncbi:MAG: hypothetical protein AAF358_03445 [Pseudomonadota bacterium]
MKTTKILIMATMLLVCSTSNADPENSNAPQYEREAVAFFDAYLGVYNRRFGRPELSETFRQELSEIVYFPVLQSPASGQPRVPASMEKFTRGFEGFVTMLERKGVHRLAWESQEFHQLSENKLLANNVGVGYSVEGEPVYHTASLYLVYQTDAGWKITLFSPYDVDKPLHLSSE